MKARRIELKELQVGDEIISAWEHDYDEPPFALHGVIAVLDKILGQETDDSYFRNVQLHGNPEVFTLNNHDPLFLVHRGEG